MKRILNWRPDLPDHRDHIYKPKQVSLKKLPARKDLRAWCSPVEDQGALGSCVGQSVVGALELLDRRGHGFDRTHTDLSTLFVYYCAREYINEVRNDSGAYIRDGIKAVHKTGAASQDIWPYIPSRFNQRPPATVYSDAAKRKFQSYQRITGLDDMIRCLADGHSFVFGFTVYEGMMSNKVATTGRLDLPKPWESELGGHAVLAVGYDMKSSRFIIRNSWGERWGRKGYFTMPFEYVADRNLSDDFWTVRG